jgi:hypothetical protein
MRNSVGTVPVRSLLAEVSDGRVTVAGEVDDTALSARTPDPAPLSAGETHLTLQVTVEGVTVGVALDAEGVDALADVIAESREATVA